MDSRSPHISNGNNDPPWKFLTSSMHNVQLKKCLTGWVWSQVGIDCFKVLSCGGFTSRGGHLLFEWPEPPQEKDSKVTTCVFALSFPVASALFLGQGPRQQLKGYGTLQHGTECVQPHKEHFRSVQRWKRFILKCVSSPCCFTDLFSSILSLACSLSGLFRTVLISAELCEGLQSSRE